MSGIAPPTNSGKRLRFKALTVSSSGNNSFLTAVAGKKFRIFRYAFDAITTTALTVKLTDGNGGTELFKHTIQTPENVFGGITESVPAPSFLAEGSNNTALVVNLSSAISVNVNISYWEEDA